MLKDIPAHTSPYSAPTRCGSYMQLSSRVSSSVRTSSSGSSPLHAWVTWVNGRVCVWKRGATRGLRCNPGQLTKGCAPRGGVSMVRMAVPDVFLRLFVRKYVETWYCRGW